MKLPSKSLEKKLFKQGYKYIIAVDEVGVGPLAGPVTACAVLITPKFFTKRNKNLHWLRDSKMLSVKKREGFAKELGESKDIKFALSYSRVKTIDKINIYQAARAAMQRAVSRLLNSKFETLNSKQIQNIKNQKSKTVWNLKKLDLDIVSNFELRASNLKTIVLVDGKTKIKGLDIEQMPIVKGDRKIFSIACASVIAKVARDKSMLRYSKNYPKYGFEKHKGYGTKLHKICLTKHGPCEIHRKSFRPIAKMVASIGY